MRVSEKRRQALYDVIHAAVTDARLAVIKLPWDTSKGDPKIDGAIAQVADRAFRAVMRVLEKGTP
jgi:hypothetical protein